MKTWGARTPIGNSRYFPTVALFLIVIPQHNTIYLCFLICHTNDDKKSASFIVNLELDSPALANLELVKRVKQLKDQISF